MSLPITAVGPLKVETNPILMVSAAVAGCASANAMAPASQYAFVIFTPLLNQRPAGPTGPPPRFARVILGDVFCARNRKSAASTNRRTLLEPSAHTRAGCTI